MVFGRTARKRTLDQPNTGRQAHDIAQVVCGPPQPSLQRDSGRQPGLDEPAGQRQGGFNQCEGCARSARGRLVLPQGEQRRCDAMLVAQPQRGGHCGCDAGGFWQDVDMSPVLRPAGLGDGPFLRQMLVAAAYWRPDAPAVSVDQAIGRRELAHYVTGWPQPGDLGQIAEDDGPIGAAWLRVFCEDDPGFGFVDAQTPELAMGVLPQWRGRGVGAKLLGAVIADAADAGLAGISLSVERDNYAARLYERFGFGRVGEVGQSFTMLLRF